MATFFLLALSIDELIGWNIEGDEVASKDYRTLSAH
jgi:hypothetical protein